MKWLRSGLRAASSYCIAFLALVYVPDLLVSMSGVGRSDQGRAGDSVVHRCVLWLLWGLRRLQARGMRRSKPRSRPTLAGCGTTSRAGPHARCTPTPARYVTAIAEGRFRDAYLIARAPNPFASICGRVCAAPCETACRRGTVDAPVAIRALKRFVTERFGVESFAGDSVWHEAHGPVPPPTLRRSA